MTKEVHPRLKPALELGLSLQPGLCPAHGFKPLSKKSFTARSRVGELDLPLPGFRTNSLHMRDRKGTF